MKKNCVKYCIRIEKNVLYASEIPNFIGKHSNTPIHKSLQKN